MEKLLCKFFSFLKYVLFIIAFGLVFFGVVKTYNRLDKSLVEAVWVFIPFAFVLVMFIINMFYKNKYVNDNLFFNFVSFLVFGVIIMVCLRAMFDTNMILYHRYEIGFNPSYFADNLSLIEALLYMIGAANVLLFVSCLIDKDKKKLVRDKVVISEKVEIKEDKKEDTKKEENDEKVEDKKETKNKKNKKQVKEDKSEDE